ncbi:GntR family transcriptional regulator [Desmospora activa]|uniref:GntR family transcriptional regulator n=1 Tax=Desmospora activa DSM 45169 TaxID=1121389 RepID=A0A2T4Z7S4_9BACL|nr:GntR family transcriptional regulator [Desmospora activa]PTM57933.1 GntR family transcriptional regulator [Desmospora activa DSM 45169]
MHSKRQSAGDVAYHAIKRKIIEWDYQPNQPLNEEMLTSDLAISRTPLRQALHRLELEGLIFRHSNGRITVAAITVDEAEEVFKVREVLEGLVAKEAAQHITAEQIEELEEKLSLMERAAQKGHSQKLIQSGSEFHQLLYTVAQNQTAIRFLEQLNSRIERYRRLGGYLNPDYPHQLPVQEHRAIFDAVQKRDAQAAEMAMRAHIRRSLESVEETLRGYLQPR